MATPEQLAHIRQRLATGASRDQIADELRASAWSDEAIKEVMAEVDGPEPTHAEPSPDQPAATSPIESQSFGHRAEPAESPDQPPDEPPTRPPDQPADHSAVDWRVKRTILRT